MRRALALLLFLLAGLLLHTPARAQADPLAVEVVDESEGSVGERFVYLIREGFRRSAAFRLTYEAEPRVQVIVNTMPRFDDRPNTATMYSVVWTFVAWNGTGWDTLYWDSTIGYAGTQVVQSAAEGIVSQTDRMVVNLRRRSR